MFQLPKSCMFISTNTDNLDLVQIKKKWKVFTKSKLFDE